MTGLLLGVDFDNTLVSYGQLFAEEADRRGWLPVGFSGDRTALRTWLRQQPGGEERWQRLQAEVYYRRIGEARPAPGSLEALRQLRDRGVGLCIVSHKSRAPRLEPTWDLRAAASRWLEDNGVLGGDIGITPADVWYEPTRASKVARIVSLGCTHFIDDLPEVFAEPGFPEHIVVLHYASDGTRWDDVVPALLGVPR